MRNSPAAWALLLLAACASAPAEEAPAPVQALSATDRYGPLISEAAAALLAAEPKDAVPERLDVAVIEVEEAASELSFEAALRRSRREQEYVIYGQCAVDDIPACASQVVAGARMLRNSGR